MVPSPPQRIGHSEFLPAPTFDLGQPVAYRVWGLEPIVNPNSTVQIVVNGESSTIGEIKNNKTSLVFPTSSQGVVDVTLVNENSGFEFLIDSDFTIDTFELYIDSQKVNLTHA